MTTPTATTWDVQSVRAQFPTLARSVHGKPLVYLDNAATTQKPRGVIDVITEYYEHHNANVHRGVHALSAEATEMYEAVRPRVARFLNAPSDRQIVFTRGTTESINLVAQSHARSTLKPDDEIILSTMEHHSNIVPWQIVAEQTGAVLRIIPINDRGELLLDAYDKLLTARTKIVSIVQVSNSLGTINPVKEMARLAHEKAPGCAVVVDGAQWVGHFPVDVQDLGCDFYAFSGHKLFGPTGVGVLYGRRELLDAMPPWQGGGDMILSVSFENTRYNDVPLRFEAGTPHIEGVIGLGAALDYLDGLDRDAAAAHEHDLLDYGTARLREIQGLRLIGTADRKAAVLSFVLDFAHPLDAGTIMDRSGVAVRTGHHCCQPVMDRFGIPGTIRASMSFYNTRDELDALAESIEKVRRFL